MITILGLVAFYSPIQDIRQPQSAPESEENYSASLNTISASSTMPDSNQTSTSSASDKTSFKDLSGFSDLNQESELLEETGSGSTSTVDDIFNEF